MLRQREVPLGGPRAMTVRRSLPQRERSLIGAWCFIDHYGPDDVSISGGMALPGHPHTGLQTVSWLFAGEIEHRDTTGAHQVVRPGQLNLMTAGSGIAHSEFSTPGTTVLHGAQLWVALPAAHRGVERSFQHYAAPEVEVGPARVRVFLGALFGQSSPVQTWSPLTGAEITLPAAAAVDLPVPYGHEHGLLCDHGSLSVGATTARRGEVLFQPLGSRSIRVQAGSEEPCRFLLLGGEPLGEELVMWWNFIGGSHEEIVALREDWQRQREARSPGRYGPFPPVWRQTLPAPELPHVRLRPRS